MILADVTQQATWITVTLFLLDAMIRVGLSLRVVMRRRGVGESLAWLAIVLVLPFAGAAIYIVLGENRLGRARLRRASEIYPAYRDFFNSLNDRPDVDWDALPPICRAIDQQAYRVAGIPTLPGNRLDVLGDAQSALRRIIQDIDAAERTCHLEFYIWFTGGTADEVAHALMRAVDRGLECRVLLDSMGSKDFLRSDLCGQMRTWGVEVVECLPANLIRALFRRIDLRNHRKIIVVDGRVGYTGSLNMIDPRYFKKHADVGPWVDAMVRVEGEAVKPLAATFVEDWELETHRDLLRLREEADAYARLDLTPPRSDPADTAGGADGAGLAEADPRSAVQVVPSGPHLEAQSIHQLLLTAIYNARQRLILTTPYFVPDESLVIAITSAAARGVDTTVILPERVDSALVRYASHAYYQDLLEAGVKIARYDAGLLHTKSVTVDDHLTIFGTVNLDMRSFYLNFELSLLVYDASFAARVRALQVGYLQHCTLLDVEAWRNRPVHQRVIENVTRLLSPLL